MQVGTHAKEKKLNKKNQQWKRNTKPDGGSEQQKPARKAKRGTDWSGEEIVDKLFQMDPVRVARSAGGGSH
ncbi:hypothetical protein MUK42_37331 [Musa troglodytarum]|uniref:Uncharacterized protein n=1 Tax=Musa troglodytarum TaxID=320322 RepID=A0A9E7J924_9LILI|nr:hypothetical protein MUK42_37331 [Musa troglodytarum]